MGEVLFAGPTLLHKGKNGSFLANTMKIHQILS